MRIYTEKNMRVYTNPYNHYWLLNFFFKFIELLSTEPNEEHFAVPEKASPTKTMFFQHRASIEKRTDAPSTPRPGTDSDSPKI